MMVGWVCLVLTGACQFGHGVGGFTANRPPHTNARGPEAVRGAGCPMEKNIKIKETVTSQIV